MHRWTASHEGDDLQTCSGTTILLRPGFHWFLRLESRLHSSSAQAWVTDPAPGGMKTRASPLFRFRKRHRHHHGDVPNNSDKGSFVAYPKFECSPLRFTGCKHPASWHHCQAPRIADVALCLKHSNLNERMDESHNRNHDRTIRRYERQGVRKSFTETHLYHLDASRYPAMNWEEDFVQDDARADRRAF